MTRIFLAFFSIGLAVVTVSTSVEAQNSGSNCPTLTREDKLDRVRQLRSKHRKVLEKLFSRPTPASLRFGDVDAMLTSLGANRAERAGSRVMFELHGQTIVIHAPHPAPTIKKSSVNSIRQFLADLEYGP